MLGNPDRIRVVTTFLVDPACEPGAEEVDATGPPDERPATVLWHDGSKAPGG